MKLQSDNISGGFNPAVSLVYARRFVDGHWEYHYKPPYPGDSRWTPDRNKRDLYSAADSPALRILYGHPNVSFYLHDGCRPIRSLQDCASFASMLWTITQPNHPVVAIDVSDLTPFEYCAAGWSFSRNFPGFDEAFPKMRLDYVCVFSCSCIIVLLDRVTKQKMANCFTKCLHASDPFGRRYRFEILTQDGRVLDPNDMHCQPYFTDGCETDSESETCQGFGGIRCMNLT